MRNLLVLLFLVIISVQCSAGCKEDPFSWDLSSQYAFEDTINRNNNDFILEENEDEIKIQPLKSKLVVTICDYSPKGDYYCYDLPN